ncbi:flagellar filament capping protein FliD [Microbacterium sp. KSW2-29]|uniref:Flagellar hook-associated protein 2 n=1 Tax=Microbacterium phycohabitans TaxID=3075993 RepID=A0ABU3SHS4_9MICO|nr:flagellar filament capping protein FliD [Microbacterium sp. KSW2-29]MDU0344349.1 flagellar filament capping protein FliD [Microbacterium sp. KSW2-29]
MQIDGLASGIKTKDVIDALINVAAIPKTLVTNRITDRNSVISNLQSLNTALQALTDKAKAAASSTSLARYTASSSSEAVTVVAGETARAFSTDIVVDTLARAHAVVTAAGDATAFGGTFSLVAADGSVTEVTGSGSAAELAAAINAAKAGVTATVVPGGRDAQGAALSRIQITSTRTGAEGAFSLHRGTAAEVAASTSVDVATAPGAAVLAQGTDAVIRLFAGTAAEQVVTSASNTFTDVGEGIDITVGAVSADPVTVTVTPDAKAQSDAASAFVKEIATLLTRIDNGSKATVAAPGKTTTLGVFTGDSTVRSLRAALASAVQSPVDGVSPSTIGITVDKAGVLSFDADRFAAAMADDPEAVQSVFAAVSARVQATTTQYSDKYNGLVTQRITGQQGEVKTLEKQVERMDLRLDMRRATLERTYAAMEVRLSGLQSRSDWLTSQLSALTPSSK